MGRFTRTLGPVVTITGALALWLVVMVSVGATSPRQNSGTKASPAAAPATEAVPAAAYAGDDTCLTCHEEKTKGYHGSAHARVADPRTPAAGKGCESCHGPGQAHVEAGGDKSLILVMSEMSPRDVSEACTTCHNRSAHSEWDGSKHDSRNMGCTTCHSVHDSKSEKGQLKGEPRRKPACSATRRKCTRSAARRTCRLPKARWSVPPATTRTDRRT
jgi:hypothetical protein